MIVCALDRCLLEAFRSLENRQTVQYYSQLKLGFEIVTRYRAVTTTQSERTFSFEGVNTDIFLTR